MNENLKNISQANSDEVIISDTKLESIDQYKYKWYVLNCYSGREKKVIEKLKQKIKTARMEKDFSEILMVEKTTRSKKTKKILRQNLYPGYLFVNMKMSDEAWFLVRNTEGIVGFVGSSGKGTKPFPLSTEEAKNMLKKTDIKTRQKAEADKTQVFYHADFEVNDYVRIHETAFDKQEGQVLEKNDLKGLVTVALEIFGRIIPTKVPYSNCKKIEF